MKATNIQWDVDINDVMERLNSMTNCQASDILFCPYEQWKDMADKEREKFVIDALQDNSFVTNKIMELPDSVVIPKRVYEKCDDRDIEDRVSDWLTETYGFCHCGFDFIRNKKIWFRAGMEIELFYSQYNKLLELHETRNYVELERFVEWMVRNGTMSGETYIPEYENGLDGTDYDNPDKEISVLM